MNKALTTLCTLVSALAYIGQAGATNLISNGDFGTGDFTGFSLSTYQSNGGIGTSFTSPVVSSINLGNGLQTAATFQIGLSLGLPYSAQGGVSLSQQFTTIGGMLAFWALIGDDAPLQNGDDGTFQLDIDGTPITSINLGSVYGLVTQTFSTTVSVAAGVHDLTIDVFRGGYASANTPIDYLTSVSLTDDGSTTQPSDPSQSGGSSGQSSDPSTQGPVDMPEPGSMLLVGAGLVVAALSSRPLARRPGRGGMVGRCAPL